MALMQQLLLGNSSAAAASLIKSIQQVSISIGPGAASNTATISSVTTGNAVIIFNGWTTNSTTQVAQDDMPSVVLTNSTTVTAQRNHASGSWTLVVKATVIEFAIGVIKSMQPFSISMSTSSGTATISAVTTANSAVAYNGFTCGSGSNDNLVFSTSLFLTNSTTVTATNNTSGNSIVVYGTVIEFNSGVLNSSTQQGTVTVGSGSSSATATISSVNTGQTMIIWGGNNITSGENPFGNPWLTLTNGTTVTGTRTGTSGIATCNFTALEFKTTNIKSVNRGSITIATSNTINTASISAVNTSLTAMNYLSTTNTGSSGVGPGYYFGNITLTNSTTVTATRGLSNPSFTETVGWETIEFK